MAGGRRGVRGTDPFLPCVSPMLRRLCAFVLAACWIGAAAAGVPVRDVPGGRDSPIVSRFQGSVLIGYQQQDYASLVVPLGAYDEARADHFAASESVEGRLTRIAYAAPDGKSALEVLRNFEQALRGAGFQIRFECLAERCGGFKFSRALATPATAAMHGDSAAMDDLLYAANGNVLALSARLDRAGGRVDVSLLVSQDERRRAGILLQTVEARAMDTQQVSVDARAIGQGIAQQGHIALYGLRFANDSARLDAASQATLAEIEKFLKASPQMKVYVVGHTDNTGTLAHNLQLSQQRAEAVVAALLARGIAAPRLAAKGLASYAPVAGNGDEDGRARNRRVELVAQ